MGFLSFQRWIPIRLRPDLEAEFRCESEEWVGWRQGARNPGVQREVVRMVRGRASTDREQAQGLRTAWGQWAASKEEQREPQP